MGREKYFLKSTFLKSISFMFSVCRFIGLREAWLIVQKSINQSGENMHYEMTKETPNGIRQNIQRTRHSAFNSSQPLKYHSEGLVPPVRNSALMQCIQKIYRNYFFIYCYGSSHAFFSVVILCKSLSEDLNNSFPKRQFYLEA